MKARCIAAIGAVLLASWAVAAPQTQPGGRELRLRIVHAGTGKPLPGIQGEFSLDNREGKPFTADERGECRLPVDPGTRSLWILCREQNFVEQITGFGEEWNAG